MSYGKFFPSTFTGSMAGAGAHVFAVWGYCLANGYGGQVDLNPLVVAALIGCSRADVDVAIQYLCTPDPNSRSKQNEGRRLTHLTGVVYEIVNYDPYHRMATQESVREYHRSKKRSQRDVEIPPTCPGHVPENGRSRSSSLSDPDPERARESEPPVKADRILPVGVPAVARTISLPSKDPPKEYLDVALMGGVKPEQARSTWAHYWGAGLPPGGVERLHDWLTQRAVERANSQARVRASPAVAIAAPPKGRPAADVLREFEESSPRQAKNR